MTISELIYFGTKYLKNFSPTPSLDAEVLLGNILNQPKEILYSNFNTVIGVRKINLYKILLQRRKTSEPIAYITGKKEFYGLKFYVNKSVLIPRPETELLIDETIKSVREFQWQKPPIIADIGTGSGCVAITLAKILNTNIKYIYAIDISKKALRVAKMNACYHGVSGKIKLKHDSILTTLQNKKIDIIIANLPYLPEERIDEYYLQCPSITYEPKKSLFAKEKGVYWYNKLLKQILLCRSKPRLIFLEIGTEQQAALYRRLEFLGAKINILKDLRNNDRLVKIDLS